MVIFPLAPDQTIAQMWSSGARRGQNSQHCHWERLWEIETRETSLTDWAL